MAAKISSQVLKEYFVRQMEECIDEEKSITHEQLTDNTDAALLDPKQFRQFKLPSDVSWWLLHDTVDSVILTFWHVYYPRLTNPTLNGAIHLSYRVEVTTI